MRLLSHVVWSEGMHLSQHHFQAQNRYFEDLLGFSVAQLFFEPWGAVDLEMDGDALRNGTVALIHGSGIMPDGLTFQFPADPPPAPLPIAELFSPERDAHDVLLTVPPDRPGRAGVAAEQESARDIARFAPMSRAFADETTGSDEKDVAIARKNFRLMLAGAEAADDRVEMPIARVRRDGSGNFVYDPNYVAPCLRVGASARLLEILGSLGEMLEAKAGSLAAALGATRGDAAGQDSRSVAESWLAHAIHSALPPLRHMLHTRAAHPETLYVELSRLAGALCTFSIQADPGRVPAYDHRALGECFGTLDRQIRGHLEVVLPTRALRIALQPLGANPHFHGGPVTDPRCLGPAGWYLGLRSTLPAGELVSQVPSLVKVCSAKHIVRLVQQAFPGLGMRHVSRPPSQISPRADTEYFQLEPAGPCWTSIVNTGEVGIYLPASIAAAGIELAVLPDEAPP